MASDFQMNNVFRGDFIVAQTEVIFFKRKKKKKQPTPKRCILLITTDTVALTDPKKDGKAVLMFPRNTITNFRFNTDDSQYKLEVSVFINNKTHELCIEFPTNDARQQRDIFIKHFTIDKAKPLNNAANNQPIKPEIHIKSEPNTQTHTNIAPIKSEPPNTVNTVKSQPIKPQNTDIKSSHQKRGTKRKHTTMNEDTLRKRACKLAKHKYLNTLYKTLVCKDVLTPHQFWDEYGTDIDIKHCSDGLIEGMSNMVLHDTVNNTTWSLFSEFKDDIERNELSAIENEDNKRKLKINLTPDRILKIFVNLPEVKLAYDRNVPFMFSEKEFWKAFRQSHYFKRGTTRNVTSGISDKETQIDKILKKCHSELQQRDTIRNMNAQSMESDTVLKSENSFARQLQLIQKKKNEEVKLKERLENMTKEIAMARLAKDSGNKFVGLIDSGEIHGNVSGKIEKIKPERMDSDGDVSMTVKKKSKEDTTVNYKRKLDSIDASVDLTQTRDSFSAVLVDRDPGVDENMRRDDVQRWFGQINKHGMMLLYQSIKQKKSGTSVRSAEHLMTSVPRVLYGNKYKMALNEMESIGNGLCAEEGSVWEKDSYLESEFTDLNEEKCRDFMELKIEDQSVYWGDNLLMDKAELTHINQIASQLNNYFAQVEQRKKRLCEQEIKALVSEKCVWKVIAGNTEGNGASVKGESECGNVGKDLMIYTRMKGEIRANQRILDQLSHFQKPMKELVRHYWKCFPANEVKLRKSETIVTQLKEYKSKLVEFQNTLDKKGTDEFTFQKVLLQELIDLADKVLEHCAMTRKRLNEKKLKRQKLMGAHKTFQSAKVEK